MVTDSILSVIIFKWAVINDVSVVRVLQAPGWMTSALRLRLPSFFKLSLTHARTRGLRHVTTALSRIARFSPRHTHTHTENWRRERVWQQVPRCKA